MHNNLLNNMKSEIKLFVDDIKLFIRLLSKETRQMDINEFSYWKIFGN